MNRNTAIILAVFLGGLGIHRFYVGRVLSGFIYLIFSWTFIPLIIGILEAISWSTMSNEQFFKRYHQA